MHSSQTYFPCDLRQNLLPQHGFSAQGDGSMRRGGPELQPGRVSPEMGSRVCSGATAAAFPHIPLLRAPLSKALSPEETPFLSAGSFEEKYRKGNVGFLGGLSKPWKSLFPELSRRGRGAGQRGLANKMFGFFARCFLSGHCALPEGCPGLNFPPRPGLARGISE